jgi:hypothetical protein
MLEESAMYKTYMHKLACSVARKKSFYTALVSKKKHTQLKSFSLSHQHIVTHKIPKDNSFGKSLKKFLVMNIKSLEKSEKGNMQIDLIAFDVVV